MAVSPDGAHAIVLRVSDLPGAPVDADESVVALTFDDGPHPQWTPAVLDALAACRAPATFFVRGAQVAKRPHLVERMVREGHTVGNHSWSHSRPAPPGDAGAEQAMEDEVVRTGELLRELTGVAPRYFRPPYQKTEAARYAARLSRRGIVTVIWSIDPRDWSGSDARQITDAVLSALHPGAIVLLHAGGKDHTETVRAVPMIVEGVRDLGYRLVAL